MYFLNQIIVIVITICWTISVVACQNNRQIVVTTNNTPIEGWDKDAGLVNPFATILSVSSSTKGKTFMTDQNPQTAWQSGAALPTGFIERTELNVLLNNQIVEPSQATDGNLNSSEKVNESFLIPLKIAQKLNFVSIKLGTQIPVTVSIQTADKGWQRLGTYSSRDAYKVKRYTINNGSPIEAIRLTANASFEIFEVAAMQDDPTEFVILDLGEAKPIGTIHTRHYNDKTKVKAINILWSKDGQKWITIDNVRPENTQTYITHLDKEQLARYVKIEFTLIPTDWNKVQLWEVAVYDENGHYGAVPTFQKRTEATIEKVLGVNGIWGWGHNKYSNLVERTEGPDRYRSVASHARNYHDMKWDLLDPDNTIDYTKMATKTGTEAQWWLNWNQEYMTWKRAGYKIQSTVQIHNFAASEWNNPEASAYEYGLRFAKHFGPNGHDLVEILEIGNEPWKYDATTYNAVLRGMAKGAKKGDKQLLVLPAALQAADPSMEQTTIFKNYIGDRLTGDIAPYLDGLNIHCYSWEYDELGKRRGVHPEHPTSTYREMFNAIRFRDANMPNKPIYLTEWGWDADGGGESCTHDECVSEAAATAYAIRGVLMAIRMGIERASWYFYANTSEQSSLFTRSGLTSTPATGFQEKQVFLALQQLVQQLGNCHISKIIQEDNNIWAYQLEDQNGKTYLVLWTPKEFNKSTKVSFSYAMPTAPLSAVLLDGNNKSVAYNYNKGLLTLEVGTTPILIDAN